MHGFSFTVHASTQVHLCMYEGMGVSEPACVPAGSEVGAGQKGDAYRYLAGEAEVAGRTALLAAGVACAAVGCAAGRVLSFPSLRRRLSCRFCYQV